MYETYVVDLIKIVGLQNPGADDTSTVGGAHRNGVEKKRIMHASNVCLDIL